MEGLWESHRHHTNPRLSSRSDWNISHTATLLLATAHPDKGWDPCSEPTEGLRRAIERKRGLTDNRLMTAFETKLDDALAAWPIRGLARRFPAKDLETLKTLLQKYAYLLPGDLPHGVKFVRAGGPDDDFYMATDGRGGFWFREIEYQDFNSRRDLFGGLAACASGRLLTPNQEYALESLWHEIWHNRQRGAAEAMRLELGHPLRRFAETLNQAGSRLTYPRFIEHLGGTASHQAWVIAAGYGYQKTVSRLWQVVEACGLNPTEVAGDLATVNASGDLVKAHSLVAGLLAKRSGARKAAIQAALEMLSARPDLFMEALSEIKS